jgi:hypothetical protein
MDMEGAGYVKHSNISGILVSIWILGKSINVYISKFYWVQQRSKPFRDQKPLEN